MRKLAPGRLWQWTMEVDTSAGEWVSTAHPLLIVAGQVMGNLCWGVPPPCCCPCPSRDPDIRVRGSSLRSSPFLPLVRNKRSHVAGFVDFLFV